MEEESIQLIEGVLDDVRPPTLDFKVIKETENYKEYAIETKKYVKEKILLHFVLLVAKVEKLEKKLITQ